MQRHKWHSSVGKLAKTESMSEINITPFIDVCLVLLIIFMVVTPMLQEGVPVNLPITDDPMKTPETKDQLRISVKSETLVYVGDQAVRPENVDEALKEVFKRSPNREIVVKGDRVLNYGQVLNVLKACRDVGFENVGLVTQPAKGPGGEGV